jgi:hypothetical protein
MTIIDRVIDIKVGNNVDSGYNFYFMEFYAIKKFHYVESIVKREAYLKDVLSAKFPQNGDVAAIGRLDKLLGKISSKALKRLIKVRYKSYAIVCILICCRNLD